MDLRQINLPDSELERLSTHIYTDVHAALSSHDVRIQRFRRYYRMWRGLERSTSNPDFEIPMLKWITFGNWARYMQALLGDDAEVVAQSRTPEAEKLSRKVGLYETWRFFEYMKGLPELSAWIFRATLFGRAHAELLYEQDYYFERRNGKDKEVLCYDGPRLQALWPNQLILPAQDNVMSVDDHAWVVRRRLVTPAQLLDGEKRGRYQGIEDNWDDIISLAEQRQERNHEFDAEKIDADRAEGVDHSGTLGMRDSVEVWEWYGKWRMPKNKRDSRPNNIRDRDMDQSELLIRYVPKLLKVIGVQDLRDIYPRSRKRTPFLDIGLVKDGSYWNPGVGELIEEIQKEDSANYKLFKRAGQFSVGPLIFYRPGSGFDPAITVYEPFQTIPSEDPAGINIVRLQADLSFAETNHQLLKGIAELVTGVSDQTLGQSFDRPNAPRTASGQAMLLQEGNVRVSLDMTFLKDDLSRLFEYCWTLDGENCGPEVFFRATEEDLPAAARNGFATMTSEEREHQFDFQLKFATSVWSREAKKQQVLALYQLSMQNPLVAQNPRALWVLLNRVWEAFGEDNFKDVVPEPPELDQPKQPKEEWALALMGEDLHVNPLDQDDVHILDHRRRLMEETEQEEDRRDHNAESIMTGHILEHEQQKRQKMLLQALANQAVQQMQQRQSPGEMPFPGQVPLQMPPPQPGGAPAPGAPEQAAALAGGQGIGGPA